ncbi:MAG: ribose 5-phosphate isomerase A [Candidatus ainarchaeum sp.]|jgi:ribose 5-phosphate isomerase A|nr:ribose 5-phosphate isomerase A [Candidatus ainarchaeum sp.]MDD3086034.1 ribose 5-phosphate isomerase A [Candidatus ainarchaeum sp.]MDD4128261.1 ribose 5-phosphate isomerase A [Candidatus ainarchaeum sp.]MDD4468047.1 ribose 5-phosphate isomerase A [Candidatus ainarchaeum sp.]
MITSERIEALLEKYVKQDTIVSFGTGPTNEEFLKKLALYSINAGVRIKIVPTSHSMALLASQLKIPVVSLDSVDIDLAFDFVDQVDEDFNYISNETTSLIRDKMIALDAEEMIVICEEKEFVQKLNWPISAEVSSFAINKTITQLMNLGEVKLRIDKDKPVLSETGHYFVDIKIDEVYDLDDLDYQIKRIPGVLETSLFTGYADRVVLHGTQLIVKSRLNNPEA